MAVDTRVIERTITIEASPETVFRLLTDPVEYSGGRGGSRSSSRRRAARSACSSRTPSRSLRAGTSRSSPTGASCSHGVGGRRAAR